MRLGSLLLLASSLAVPVTAATIKDLSKPRTIVVRPAEPTVTLDVKDAEARVILKSMQKQCGVKNLIIDPQVPEVNGTFLFKKVPCGMAFRIVLRSLGLDSVTYPNSLINVTPPK
jgi:hypothetical protein